MKSFLWFLCEYFLLKNFGVVESGHVPLHIAFPLKYPHANFLPSKVSSSCCQQGFSLPLNTSCLQSIFRFLSDYSSFLFYLYFSEQMSKLCIISCGFPWILTLSIQWLTKVFLLNTWVLILRGNMVSSYFSVLLHSGVLFSFFPSLFPQIILGLVFILFI